MPLLIVLLIAWVAAMGFTIHDSGQQKRAVAEFADRCKDKGGVALEGQRTTGGWLGCYKVEEIENED